MSFAKVEIREIVNQLRRIKREELKRLKQATYITVNDILTHEFHRRPSVLHIEAGNGLGKTQSICDYVSLVQNLDVFERIYILEYSHKACENVVNKLTNLDTKVVWHIGIEKFCQRFKYIRNIVKTIGSINYACYVCRYWQKKYKFAYVKLVEKLQDPNVQVVRPEFQEIPIPYCTQPILRAYCLSPTFDERNRIRINYTPVIVMPCHTMLTHQVIERFEKYSKKQRKERKYLLIVDEADTIFYNALRVEIPEIDFTNEDREILRKFSPKTKKLDKLIDFYNLVLDLCKDIINSFNIVTNEHISRFLNYKQHIEKFVKSFERRRKEILEYVIQNRIKTNVFRMVNALQEFLHISNPRYTLMTLEKSEDKYVLYDYDYAIRLLFDVEYPFKYFWKIILSATFPTWEIVRSRFISLETKAKILRVERKFKTYVNVYISKFEIFRKEHGVLNRNREIRFAIKNIIDCLITAVKTYHFLFQRPVKGIIIWFGNSKQFNYFIYVLRKNKVNVIQKRDYAYFIANIDGEELTILLSYVGSAFSRSVDLDQYNIAIAVAPLLRPPRNNRFWDIVDFSKAIAETLQAVMRIVRSPRPSEPKLIIFDSTLLSAFYYSLMPQWFKELIKTNNIKLLPK